MIGTCSNMRASDSAFKGSGGGDAPPGPDSPIHLLAVLTTIRVGAACASRTACPALALLTPGAPIVTQTRASRSQLTLTATRIMARKIVLRVTAVYACPWEGCTEIVILVRGRASGAARARCNLAVTAHTSLAGARGTLMS